MPPLDFHIHVPIGPSWRNVELLRSSVLNCLAAIFQDNDFCQTVGMVAGELLENAIKYGDWSGATPVPFEIEVHGDGNGVEVTVRNPVAAASAGALRESVAFINGFDSPAEAYVARLREIADLPPESAASGLGLVRVAYESGCELRVTVEDTRVEVRAVTRP